jgi:hypothetical protein
LDTADMPTPAISAVAAEPPKKALIIHVT